MNNTRNISLLYRKMNTMTNVELAPLNLSSSKAMFLFCIYDHENGFMSQAEICRELDMDKSTVAKMLMRMEKDGLVTKSVNSNDIRSYNVTLTDKANKIVNDAKKIVDTWQNKATGCLSASEKKCFYELLEKIVTNITELEKLQ